MTAELTKAILLAQSDNQGSPIAGAVILYVAIMTVAVVVGLFVLRKETRTRRKARDAATTSSDDEDGQT